MARKSRLVRLRKSTIDRLENLRKSLAKQVARGAITNVPPTTGTGNNGRDLPLDWVINRCIDEHERKRSASKKRASRYTATPQEESK